MGRLIRRIETARPGELVHVDVKKLHQVPRGGGWRGHGRGVVPQFGRPAKQIDYIHTVIDAYSRVAYVEVWSDNGPGYRSLLWRNACGSTHP